MHAFTKSATQQRGSRRTSIFVAVAGLAVIVAVAGAGLFSSGRHKEKHA